MAVGIKGAEGAAAPRVDARGHAFPNTQSEK